MHFEKHLNLSNRADVYPANHVGINYTHNLQTIHKLSIPQFLIKNNYGQNKSNIFQLTAVLLNILIFYFEYFNVTYAVTTDNKLNNIFLNTYQRLMSIKFRKTLMKIKIMNQF